MNKNIADSDDEIVFNSLSNFPINTNERTRSINTVFPAPSTEERTGKLSTTQNLSDDETIFNSLLNLAITQMEQHVLQVMYLHHPELKNVQENIQQPKTLLNLPYKMNIIRHKIHLAM